MSHKLINRSPDIMKLRNEGYEVSLNGAYLVITNVPYVNGKKEIGKGVLVTDITIGVAKQLSLQTTSFTLPGNSRVIVMEP